MTRRPRLGFLGLGWIGRARLRAVAESGRAEIVAVSDPDTTALGQSRTIVPCAQLLSSFDELLEQALDGVVIATPSGFHALHCARALERGLAVFCQKPLGRTAAEVAAITAAARRADRPFAVDFSYRETAALRALRDVVTSGELGTAYAVDATFHNAYGPDKSWAHERGSAGGGCLIDLGVHLLDSAAWLLPDAEPLEWCASLHANGRRLSPSARDVEDYATAQLAFSDGAVIRLACSWRSSFGADASIRLVCTGSRASASFENVDGSFHDFRCELFQGTRRKLLAAPPDDWGGRALLAWVHALESDAVYHEDPRLLRVARQLDLLYGHAPSPAAAAGPAHAFGANA